MELQEKLYEQYHITRKDITLSIPCIPIVSGQLFGSEEKIVSDDRKESFLKTMDVLDKNIQQQTVQSLKAYFGKKDERSQSDWEFLAYYLNPFDKRGVIRLRKLGLKQQGIDELKIFYKESVKKDVYVLNTHVLNEFSEAVVKILDKS